MRRRGYRVSARFEIPVADLAAAGVAIPGGVEVDALVEVEVDAVGRAGAPATRETPADPADVDVTTARAFGRAIDATAAIEAIGMDRAFFVLDDALDEAIRAAFDADERDRYGDR